MSTVTSPSPRKKKKKRDDKKNVVYPQRLAVNTFNSEYEVVSQAAKRLRFVESKVMPNYSIFKDRDQADSALGKQPVNKFPTVDPEDFDLIWFDLAVDPDVLYKLRPYQRISQFPGIQIVAHKNKLGQNMMAMMKEFPHEYDFLPATYILPYEMNLFKAQFFEQVEKKETPVQPGRKLKKSKPNFETVPKLTNKTFIIKPECESQGKGIYLSKHFEEVNIQDH